MLAFASAAGSPPPRPARPLKRGAVTLGGDGCDVRWNDVPVGLSPVESVLVATLLRRTRLSWDETAAVLADAGCCPGSRDVLIHRIRRKFAAIGARDPIETLRGHGIRFRTEPDARGSRTFWIGSARMIAS